jgi:hypothetical protein
MYFCSVLLEIFYPYFIFLEIRAVVGLVDASEAVLPRVLLKRGIHSPWFF